MSNEFDAAVAATMQPDQGQAARVGFFVAADTNPDAYAEAQRVARRTGVPVDTVLNMPKEMKQQDTMGTIDFDALAKTAPATASLLSDIERAKVAHDNVDNMGEIERKLRQFGGGAVEAAGMAASGTGQLLNIAQRNLLGGFARVFLPKPIGGGEINYDSIAGPLLGEDWIRAGGAVKGFGRNDLMIPAAQQTFGDQVASGLGQVGAQILMLPLTRGAGLYTQGADTMAEKIAPDIADQGMKDLAVLGGAAVTGITEKWALDKLLGPLAVPIKNKIAASLARVGIASAAEGGQEFSENLLQDTLRVVLTNPNAKIDVGQSLGEGGVGAAVGGIVRSIVEAGLHIRVRGERRTQQAEQGAEFFDNLNKLAAADKLLARDPGTFEQFVAQAAEDGPVQQVFIDAQTLMQSGVAEQLAAISPAIAAQLETAVQTGGQIAIPVEEYATRIAPTEYAQSLLDHIKADPEGFSRAEAQQYMQGQAAELEQEVERTLAEKQGDDTFKASAEVVRNEIRTQLDTAARFTPQVNDAYSAMVSNFYATMAAKMGTTPEELFQRYPLKIAAERIDGQQFDQSAEGGRFDQGGGLKIVRAGDVVDGLVVREDVPNMGSISASLDDYTVMAGVREVPITAFDESYINSIKPDKLDQRTRDLADEIKASGELNPLIVAFDSKGAYIIEGGHRFDALIASGAKSIPAVVVIDESDPPAWRAETSGTNIQSVAGPDETPTPIQPESDGTLSAELLDHAKAVVREVESLAEQYGKVYVRWSPTSERDLSGERTSRDFVTGESHGGLSAVEVTRDTHPVDIAKALSEYMFLRMQNADSVPWVYTAERVGTDSDSHALIKPTKLLLEVDGNLLAAIDARFADVMALQDDIATAEKQLELASGFGKEIVENSLSEKRQALAKLYHPNPTRSTQGAEVLNQSAVTVEQKDASDFLAAKSDAGLVGGHIRDGALRISYAEVIPEMRGKGEGLALYAALVDKALSAGLKVFSDATVEADAVRVYDALKRRGYDVRRLAGGQLEDGAVYGTDAKQPAFEITAGPQALKIAAERIDGQQFDQSDGVALSVAGGQVPEQSGVVRVIYRGTNDSGERISGGIAEGTLFAASDEATAKNYAGTGGKIERIGVKQDAKVLVEGTKEFAQVTGRRRGKLIDTMRKGENLKTAADDAAAKARAAGYDALEFTSFKDLGIAIFNEDKFVRDYSPSQQLNQSPAFDGPEVGNTPIGDATEIEVDGVQRPTRNSNVQVAAHGRGGEVFDWSNPGGRGLRGAFARETKIGDTTIIYGVGSNGTAEIISVRTPQAKRGAGSARRALEAFLAEADQRGLQVKLQASPLDKKTSLAKLVKFYQSLGFELTGRKINAAGDPEMVRAARNREPAGGTFDADTIEVDGVQRPTRNSNGQPIHPTEEGIRNFWRWFGDSEVVDEQGRPLAVYHGTNADFSEFDPEAQGSSGQGSGEPGFFFEASPDNAGRYTRQGGGANVMPVYLSLKNPLVVERTNGKYDYDGSYSRVAFANFIDDALELGHDGVIFRDVLDRGKRSTQYVAFSPEQIKSATGNQGTFDPANPNILKQGPRPELPETIEVDGVQRPTRNSAGQLIHPTEEGIRNFWRWFGSSRVVDDQGRPLVVYHGVKDADMRVENGAVVFTPKFDVFDTKGRIEPGAYFSPDPKVAAKYGTPIPFYLKAVAPAREEGPLTAAPENADAVYRMRGKGDSIAQAWEIAVFRPEQIKSATGNRGTFDPANPNNLKQGPRGAFNPASLSITLLKGADLSTFLHESGHFFLEVQADLASKLQQEAEIFGMDTLKPGERQILADTDALLRWFGVRDLSEWHNLDFEQKRSYHEQFARGFEAYLFEGKAPSIELQGLFQRFRAWLLSVYRELKALNVELTDEVRGVFDRLLATNEQITLAEQGRSMMPLFTSPEQAGMTPEEFAAYQALGVDATAEAIEDLQARGLRDMTWTAKLREETVKRLNRDAATKRKEIRREVEAEVAKEPVYAAMRWLKHGEMTTAEGEAVKATAGHRLSIPALREMFPEGALGAVDWQRLGHGKYGMLANEGLHPDLVAEMFGFQSGDAMVRHVLDAQPFREVVEAATDLRMLERYGELATPEAIAKAADEAIHNDVRARFVATEANALAKATGQRKVLASAAREFARAMIARLKVRNIKPGQYANAEVRAAKAAEKASKSGDLATAAAEKRNQLIQNYATRAAYDAQENVDRGLRYLKKFEGDIKGLDADYADQIGNLLERFDLRKGQSNKAVDKRTALAEWIKAQREAGLEPDIPPELENEAFRTSYKNLTVEEFRGLVDTVRQIEHLGRLKHKLLTAADQRAYEAVRDEIAGSIRENAQGRQADTRTPTTNMGRALQGLKRFWASHIKAATWARVMDGGKDGGPMWEYFVRSANERGDMETTMRAEATAKLSEILAPVFKLGRMGGKGQFFPSINRSLNREARLAIALNTGNTGNLQRLLGGEGWTMAQLTPVLQSLTSQEWAAVQAVWDHFESYRPQIAEKERRVYGKEPEWVAPQPFAMTTADGATVTLRGGYYPIKYDPAASQRAEEHADAESAKRQLQGAYTTATTRRSFTKARVEEVSGRPLLYTLAGMYSGVNDVIHDLAWHEWLIDANRLLRSHTIDTAIREHYGPEAKQQFKTWVQDVAEGDKGAANAGEAALGRLRQGVSASGLGFNVMSAAIQLLGFNQSIVRVGAKWVGRGIAKYLSNPLGLTRTVNEMSSFMENRARTRFRELNELRNQVQDQSAFNEFVGRYAYFMMMRVQQVVDVPTWWGAYEKAIAAGNEETRAVALADQAVIDAQGGGQTKDLSAIERGGPALRLFTVFYFFMNTALNLGVAQTMGANTPAKRAKLAVDYLMLYTVPAVLGYTLKAALTPGDSGDDDLEEIAKKLAAEQLSYLMGLMVVVREFGEVAKIATGNPSFGYQGPAGVRAISDAQKFGQQAMQGEFDDAFRKSAVNLIGDFTGLPAAQINRTLTGTQALAEGKTENPAAVAFGFQEKR